MSLWDQTLQVIWEITHVFFHSASYQRWESKHFLKVRKSQIRKFMDSFRYRKFTKFLWCASLHKSVFFLLIQKSHISQISTKYCTNLSQNGLKVLFKTIFKICINLIKASCYIIRRKSMCLRACGSFKSENHLNFFIL
jgi:hypothetical protein